MEFLQPTTAKPIATADHPFFGKWPCITENSFGKGHLIYCGTVPSMPLLESLLVRAADRKGILKDERQYQFPVILRSGINDKGKNVHYIFNYSYEPVRVKYLYGKGISLTDGKSVSKGQELAIGPWDVSIVVEK